MQKTALQHLFKGLLNVGICLLIYKPLSPLLHK